MATVNGTLKYKQNDGSIVELNPVGVDNTARNRANHNANTIGIWELNNPISSIADVVGKWDAEHDVSGDETITTSVKSLNTKVSKLEKLPTLDLPIIGIFTDNNIGQNCTIAVPIPSVVRLLSAKGHYPTFSISGGTIGTVFEYKNPDGTIHNFALSSVSISDLGLFVSITGKSSISLPIEPGTFVWGSYKQAATATSLHVTFA